MQESVDYFEDWLNETISWNSTRDPITNVISNATRKSFGATKKEFEQEMRIRKELIECGAIKDSCYDCRKNNRNSTNTEYKDNIWTCKNCNAKWDPLRIRFKGM